MKKIIALILSIALIIGVMPIVSAQNAASGDNAQTTTYTAPTNEAPDPYIVSELTEKRTENTKHFLMSDGSIEAAVYDTAVHYCNNGSWEDIDNSLSEKTDTESREKVIENSKNSLKVKFAKKSNKNKLISVKNGDCKIKWSLEGANKVNAKIITIDSGKNAEKLSELKNNSGIVEYNNIISNVDLRYTVNGSKLKEDIILKNKTAQQSFTFVYESKDLAARLNDDGQVEIYDTKSDNQTVFFLDAPYMIDSEYACSTDIELSVENTSKGFKLTVTPNKEWLESDSRVYPVAIDPSLAVERPQSSIVSNYFVENNHNTGVAFLYVGKQGQYTLNGVTQIGMGKVCSAVKISDDSLQAVFDEIGPGAEIVNAKMVLIPPADQSSPGSSDSKIAAYKITGDWAPGCGAYSATPSHDSAVLDYNTHNNSYSPVYWDVTKAAREWQQNISSNKGILLKSTNEDETRVVKFFSTYNNRNIVDYQQNIIKPAFVVTYRKVVGLEDYWSYTSQSLGDYGTGCVNNYNGNFTYVHDDVSFTSLINGFTLSHVYNSAYSDEGTGRYGNGWGLNLVQTLKPVTIKNNPSVKYVYTDGDGTQHYFAEIDGSIVDEDGLGYTFSALSEGELVYKLTDKNGNVLKFDQWGALRRIIDTNENSIYLNYSPVPNQFNYLSSITTSSGGCIALKYDSENKLRAITDNAGRDTAFTYSGGNLIKIAYPDGTSLNLSYTGNALCQATAPDGKKLCHTYRSDKKVSTQSVKNASGQTAVQYSFNYMSSQTEVTDLQNRKLTYQFDSFGRVTCAYDNNENSYSQSYTTTSNTKDGVFANNKLSLASNNVKYVNNLLDNSAFGNGFDSWNKYIEAPNQTQISLVSDQRYVSSNSVKISSNADSIQALLQSTTTYPGQTYTVSANIKTENVVSATHGATVEIVKISPEGKSSCFCDFVTGTTDPEINNGFVTVTSTVTLGSNERISRIGVGLYKASGTVWVDSVQFEANDTPNKINLLANTSFENGSDLPEYLTNFGSSSGNGVSSAQHHGGTYSCKINGTPSQTRSVYQRVNTSGGAGDVYSFGGWGKADSVATTFSDLSKKPNFRMYLNAYNGSGISEAFEVKFNEYVTDWQFVSKTIVLKKDYTMLEVLCTYDYNCNAAYFDNVFLYRDTAQSYTYDKNGNVVSTADNAKQQSTFEYTGNNLTNLINPDGTSYTYTYDSKNNLTDAESNVGLKYHMTYDSNGNPLTSEISDSDGSYDLKITSTATYLPSGNYLSSVTDECGEITSYTYDTARGLQTKVTKNWQSTSYGYNEMNDRLESVTTGSSTVNYAYNRNGSLNKITSPSGTEYNFVYDDFGNTSQIKVGSNPLTTNTYNTYGLLKQSVYGNGQKINYSYDTLDRIKEKLYNNVVKVKFRYDESGNLYEKQDLFTGTTYRYNYDLSGRVTAISGSDNTSLGYVYDNYNRVKKTVAKIGSNSNSTEYVYGDSAVEGQKDGLIYGIKHNGNNTVNYEYDKLARLSSKTLPGANSFKTEYTYLDGTTADNPDGTTSTLVKKVKNGDNTYEYQYDDLGNIVSITKNGSFHSAYNPGHYGKLLCAEYLDGFYAYTYDDGGNILSVTKNGEAYKTYTYGNSEWKDLLTEFNGQTITYDQIGNPLSYRDGFNFTWANGRQLVNVTKGTDNISYLYNADGLRTQKTVNGVTTDYYWLNGVLQAQKTGEEYIIFLYDENGSAYGMLLKNGTAETYYYYTFNVQGDVVGIIDSTGTQVVSYEYGIWGDNTVITGTLADTIGNKNPLRYRSYYFDAETGFYYLQSRYYDPEVYRFINADSVISGTGESPQGYNLFAYCNNDPVNMRDETGHWPKWATKLIAAVAVVAVVAVVAAVTVATAGAGTAIAAVAVGAAKGAAIGFAVGAATGAAGGAISHRISTGSWNGAGKAALNGMANGALSGAVSGAITGGITGGLSYNSGATSAGKGFDTYRQLKNEIGLPGSGNEWHHIVEQSQITKSGFSPQMIQNTNNIMSISKTTHRAISGYYSSVQPFTNGMIVRNWLAGQSFSAQYEFGINVVKLFM